MLETIIQQSVNALQLGSYYSLIALGYCLVYGVLLLINFAHGDIFMVGAYIAFFSATALMGKFGLIEAGMLGASRKSFPTLVPRAMFEIGGATVTGLKLAAIAASFLVFGLLQWIVTRTKIGMAMRAVSYDKFAVPLMGIPLDIVIVFTFFLGSSMAGLAGLLYAMNFPVLDPFMGALVGWKAFIAAVVGGIGDIRGAFIGGFLLAFLEVTVAATFSSELRDLISFTILLGILSWKPTGLFGKPRTTKI